MARVERANSTQRHDAAAPGADIGDARCGSGVAVGAAATFATEGTTIDARRSCVAATLHFSKAHGCGAALRSIGAFGGAVSRAAAARQRGSAVVAVDLAAATASADFS